MEIRRNTTSMPAGLAVATDKGGRDVCVVVVKGTFAVGDDGKVRLAGVQEPLVYSDVHYGDPGATSIRYESDFARAKPRADVIVHGHAYAPAGEPATEVVVTLEVAGVEKRVRVVGDRHWRGGLIGLRPSPPAPFLKMPLVFDRAFGGADHSHPDPKHQGTEMRNPIGVGFHKNSDPQALEGKPLPNLEDPRHPIRKWSDAPPPAGFGIVGRNWQSRVRHAGTYDARWREERFPFLPEDFDDQYFLSAPADQQVPFFQGGEAVRCTNMTPDGSFAFIVPEVDVPVLFRFRDRDVPAASDLDTLIVEPDQGRFLATWRASVPLGRKIAALREVHVGPRRGPLPVLIPGGKPHFSSLEELAAWNRRHALSRPQAP